MEEGNSASCQGARARTFQALRLYGGVHERAYAEKQAAPLSRAQTAKNLVVAQAGGARAEHTYIHIPASRCFHNEQQRVGEQAEAFAQRTPERGPNSPDNNAKLRGGERQANERAKKTEKKKKQRIPNRDTHSYVIHVSAQHAHLACMLSYFIMPHGGSSTARIRERGMYARIRGQPERG